MAVNIRDNVGWNMLSPEEQQEIKGMVRDYANQLVNTLSSWKGIDKTRSLLDQAKGGQKH